MQEQVFSYMSSATCPCCLPPAPGYGTCSHHCALFPVALE